MEQIGECRCLCAIRHKQETFASCTSGNSVRGAMKEYLREHGLEVAGEGFVPYALPLGGGSIFPICLPVEPA